MVGYAYINPLAGLEYHIPLRILPCYGRLCLHQPLSGVDRSHSRHASYHGMVGYAYANPLAGLTSPSRHACPPWYGGLCLHQPLNGVGIPFSLSRSPYVIGGYAYVNPLAGLISCVAGSWGAMLLLSYAWGVELRDYGLA